MYHPVTINPSSFHWHPPSLYSLTRFMSNKSVVHPRQVCQINVIFSFHIHSPFFVSWKQNITLIWQTCWGWTTDLFDMNPVKEYKLGGCQWRKLGFIVTGWYMPYFHLFPFLLSEQYGEGEISRVLSLFMHNIFFHYDMYLLFILWKTVEHDQPFFCLALSCFFPLTLILSTLLNFLYSCYLRLESQKG